jgi:hypothetical protein
VVGGSCTSTASCGQPYTVRDRRVLSSTTPVADVGAVDAAGDASVVDCPTPALACSVVEQFEPAANITSAHLACAGAERPAVVESAWARTVVAGHAAADAVGWACGQSART